MHKVHELDHKRQELRRIKGEQRAAKDMAEFVKHQKRRKRVDQQIFQLERELRAAEAGWAKGEPVTGALPDFLVIGVIKGGTTYIYHLLTHHTYVEPAATKELHFFDNLFDEEDTEWYRRCFPTPEWKDGRRTLTGEATGSYLAHPHAPERAAEVVPQVKLIALLRNPVDRAYSNYHQQVRHGREVRTFEEAVEAEQALLLEFSQHGYSAHAGDELIGYLSEGLYVDWYLSKGLYVKHLQNWSRFFAEEQMLVLKSEDFFERPVDTLKIVLDFLDLPTWEPEASQLQKKRNTREYEKMDPATRRRLEEFFEPHNRRLYDYLGVDFGW